MAMSFTGYLLPFDQRSYWATIVGVNINGTGPLVGPYLPTSCAPGPSSARRRCRASTRSTCCSCRALIAALIGAHLYLVAKLGTTAPPWLKAEPTDELREEKSQRVNQQREGAVPPRVLAPEGAGEAVLPLRGRQGLGDGRASCMAVIIAMSIVLGAELGPKADPTTTTYAPRPEWYFFFLFELLRVIKPPALVPLATIGIPTICMILLFLLPFYDRSPERRPERRPIATTAGILTIAAMAYLTYLGAVAGLADPDRHADAGAHRRAGPKAVAQYEQGKLVAAPVGLPGLPQDRRERQRRPRAAADRDRRAAARRRRSRGRCVNPTAPMPSFTDLQQTSREVQRAGRVPRRSSRAT